MVGWVGTHPPMRSESIAQRSEIDPANKREIVLHHRNAFGANLEQASVRSVRKPHALLQPHHCCVNPQLLVARQSTGDVGRHARICPAAAANPCVCCSIVECC